jgi:hypothetical protein
MLLWNFELRARGRHDPACSVNVACRESLIQTLNDHSGANPFTAAHAGQRGDRALCESVTGDLRMLRFADDPQGFVAIPAAIQGCR